MSESAATQLQGANDFVGREAEMSALLGGLARARASRGGLVLIGGEPGIGKSRLADELARHARVAGASVLWGRCWDGGVSGSASERARLSVTRAIRLAMARIAQHSPALGQHLELAIHTGTYCAYRPDPRAPIEWQP